MNAVWAILFYVVGAPYFWASMGLTTATAMFIGVLLHDGNMRQVGKAMITISSYAFYVVLTTTPRIFASLSRVSVDHLPQAFASITTLVLVTFFYMIGLLMGVYISYIQSRRRHGQS